MFTVCLVQYVQTAPFIVNQKKDRKWRKPEEPRDGLKVEKTRSIKTTTRSVVSPKVISLINKISDYGWMEKFLQVSQTGIIIFFRVFSLHASSVVKKNMCTLVQF